MMKHWHRFGRWVGGVSLGVAISAGCVLAETVPLSEQLIDLESAAGEELLFSSQARRDYLPLSQEFLTQSNLAYCGVASMVMVLNALEVPAPKAAGYRRYRFFTQENIFDNPAARQVMTADYVARQGMTLEEMSRFLQGYPLQVSRHHGSEISLEEFRRIIRENLSQPNNFILVNYLRRALDQQGGGHISPLAAYHEASDRVLILDVARYRYPPVWVSVKDLWQATNTTDPVSGKTRGLVTIRRRSLVSAQ